MKILTCFKRVPKFGVADSISGAVNPFDEIALEEALRLRERGHATQIVAVTIGDAAVNEQCRTALAMGADRCLRIDDTRTLDPFAVARILHAVVRRESPRLVLMGKQAVDDDFGQTGQMLAGLLAWPQATFASRITVRADGHALECTREIDAGAETIAVRLPAVITADLRLNDPRYPSLPGLIKARSRPIERLTCADLGVAVDPKTTVLETRLPPQRPPGARVQSVDELLEKLRGQARAIP